MGVWWLEFKYPKVVKKPKGRALNYLYIFLKMILLFLGEHFSLDSKALLTWLSKEGRNFPDGASGKEPTCQFRRHPWVEKIPWRRHGNPLQYSYLENPMDRGAWQAIVHGVAKSWNNWSNLAASSSNEGKCEFVGL